MNCHGSDSARKSGRHHHSWHMILMILCCAVPLALLLVLPLLKIGNPFLGGAVSLICPVMMIVMMVPMFFKGNGGGGNHAVVHTQAENEKKETAGISGKEIL